MPARDLLLLIGICLVWGTNIPVSKWVVQDMGVPPVFFAALRFGLIALLLGWALRPVPRQMGRLFLISMGVGAAHFALLFLGLTLADASSAAVAVQLAVPFSTILAVVFLGERIAWRRTLGIIMAFAGVMVISVDPQEFDLSLGVMLVAGSALTGAIASIFMKQIDPMPPLRLQAWVGLLSAPPLAVLSGLVETGAWAAFLGGGAGVWIATAFAVLAVSIFGHSAYYVLLKRHELSLISPLLLMAPLWAILIGVTVLREPLTPQLIIGALVSLTGVLIIALRSGRAKVKPDTELAV
jgi:O-acetylserine/cysteine efflux transporter